MWVVLELVLLGLGLRSSLGAIYEQSNSHLQHVGGECKTWHYQENAWHSRETGAFATDRSARCSGKSQLGGRYAHGIRNEMKG